MPILTAYVEAAMAEAEYENFPDDTIYAHIPSCPGVWSNMATREECEKNLREVLEFWLLIKLRDNDSLPEIGGIDLTVVETEMQGEE